MICIKIHIPVIMCLLVINVPAHWNSKFFLATKIATSQGHWPRNAFVPPATRRLNLLMLLLPHSTLFCLLIDTDFSDDGVTIGWYSTGGLSWMDGKFGKGWGKLIFESKLSFNEGGYSVCFRVMDVIIGWLAGINN